MLYKKLLVLLSVIFLFPVISFADSFTKAKLIEIVIVTSDQQTGSKINSWGIDASHIGVSEINKVRELSFYYNKQGDIIAAKIKRVSVTGDILTTLYMNVQHISIKEAPDNSPNRNYHEVAIRFESFDKLKFP